MMRLNQRWWNNSAFNLQHPTFLILLLCLLLPTANSTLDAWYYAACVRHGHELLLPHHLLYNPAGLLWVRLLHLLELNPDTLAALKVMNALAAGASLGVVGRILRRLGLGPGLAAGWVLVVGGSFGLLRFATENEAYVLPLLASLLASQSWVKYQLSPGARPAALVWAGFWAALACLLHQIHFFWWLGLLLGTAWYAPPRGRLRAALHYALPALLVPAAYVAALPSWGLPLTLPALWHFVFHDYYAGLAGGASAHGALLTVANLVRTFAQVHGSLPALLRAAPALAGVGLVCAGLGGWAAVQAGRAFRRHRAAGAATTPALMPVQRVHLGILLAQLAFAGYSEGNAEFMVMLPALLAVAASGGRWLPARALGAAGLALLLWNVAFGLGPSHWLRFTNTDRLLTLIPAQPRDWFLLDDPNLVLNQLHYRTGNPVGPPNVRPAPTLLVRQPGQSAARLRAWLRAQPAAGRRVFTTSLDAPQLLDRAQLVYGNQNAALLQGFRTARLDSFPTFFGPRYLTEIKGP